MASSWRGNKGLGLEKIEQLLVIVVIGLNQLSTHRGTEGLTAIARAAVLQ
jgi:hypothetical protein